MMSRRTVALPSGSAGSAPAPIPQYLSQVSTLSNDSNSSTDSILTQVPMPFYLPVGVQQQEFQHGGTQEQPGGYQASFGAPNMTAPAVHPFQAPAQPSLNASSATFAPPNNDYGHAAYGLPPTNSGAPSYGQYQTAAHMGPASAYQAPNPYGQGVNAQGVNVGQYASNYGSSNPNQFCNSNPNPYGNSNPDPYGHYGQGENRFGAYQPQPNLPATYGGGYTEGGSYAPNSYAPVGGSYAPQGYGNPRSMAQYSVQEPGALDWVNPANANRGKPAGAPVYRNSTFNATAPEYKPLSQTAAVRTVNFDNRAELANNQVQNDNVVKLPSRTPSAEVNMGTRVNNLNNRAEFANNQVRNEGAVKLPSRAPSSEMNMGSRGNSRLSTRGSSDAGLSSSISHSTGGSDSVISPTPAPRRLHEITPDHHRHGEIRTLRSRRGQSIARSTDQAVMESWLENVTPQPGGESLGAKLKATPPQMMDLFKAGGLDPQTLTPVNNDNGAHHTGDPFVGPRANSALQLVQTNPFGPPAHANSRGSGMMIPPPTMSADLRRITLGSSGKPAVGEALEPTNLPFVEYCRNARQDRWGVIKIKNIPYSVNRPEVLAFLGRNARIISEQQYEPVHIVMERVTSKTLDCYVEFTTLNEAVNAINRFESNRNGGRGGRLGHRHVDVELSSQEQLMRDLFPKAKNVTWHGSRPVIKPRVPGDAYNSGFQGFISKEELVMLVKHVETPQRSPFSKDCPQRPFECLISTLLKYPWYMVDYITIDDRSQLFQTTLQLIGLLQDRIANQYDVIHLTPMLLKRVWRAGLKCPGFSPAMKDDIAFVCGVEDQLAHEMGVPMYAPYWKDFWCIGPKPGAPTDLIMYYAALIREAIGDKPEMTLAQKAANGFVPAHPDLFGPITSLMTDMPRTKQDLDNSTLAQIALIEWGAIESVLRRALTPALMAGPSA